MTLRVLHVVASAQRRGAELFAALLVDVLGQRGFDQRVAVLRPADGESIAFAAPTRSGVGRHAIRRSMGRTWVPDVVQVHGGGPLRAALAALPASRRIVYRRIGVSPPPLRTGRRRLAFSLALRLPARIVAVADAVRRETIRTFRVDARRIVTIPNAVRAADVRGGRLRSDVRGREGIPLDAPVTISVGAFTWEKDPVGVVDAIAPVVRSTAGAIHLFVGDGPLRTAAAGRVDQLGLGSRVRFLGVRRDVPDLLRASDVLVVGSVLEGMPASAIEAGVCGVPVVAYDVAGIEEVVEDGRTGTLVHAGDREALGRAIAALLADPDERSRLGAAASARCSIAFDIEPVADRYVEVYEEVAAG